MDKVKIKIKDKIGRWEILSESTITYSNYSKRSYICLCDCGVKRNVSAESIEKGASKSCGCLGRELLSLSKRTHGQRKTRVYAAWTHMKSRCYNPNNLAYPNYGGRGILVCPEWVNDYAAFFKYVGESPSTKHTLDRINNDGNYEPGNVRWATKKEQGANRRTNKYIEHNGINMIKSRWAKLFGIKRCKLHYLLNRKSISELYEMFVTNNPNHQNNNH